MCQKVGVANCIMFAFLFGSHIYNETTALPLDIDFFWFRTVCKFQPSKTHHSVFPIDHASHMYFKHNSKTVPPDIDQEVCNKQIRSRKARKLVWFMYGCVIKWVWLNTGLLFFSFLLIQPLSQTWHFRNFQQWSVYAMKQQLYYWRCSFSVLELHQS